jgi:hypothetical protein
MFTDAPKADSHGRLAKEGADLIADALGSRYLILVGRIDNLPLFVYTDV